MARYVGIDIGTTQVKVAVVRGTARKWIVEDRDWISALRYCRDGNLTTEQYNRLKSELETQFQGPGTLSARLRHDAGRPFIARQSG